MSFPKTIEKCRELNEHLSKEFTMAFPTFYIEDVGYQRSLIQTLSNDNGFRVKPVPNNTDKRSRLSLTGSAVVDGRILFPKKGAEILTDQIVNFGTERYDDLADAFSTLVLSISHHKDYFVGIVC